jgi:D-alanyl-lipoteichoic acid acyltransferase DltB (MBOAT superfamily)
MRAQNLLLQVEAERTFSVDEARTGAVLMAWGFFKKLVVADDVVSRLRLHWRRPRAVTAARDQRHRDIPGSGLWPGASWNFVLWGLYHGSLLGVTRTLGTVLRLPERWPGPLALVQVALTFAFMMGGWLFFRETDPAFLFRFLRLSPFESTPQERETALYLFMTAVTSSLPLILDDAVAFWRERTSY